MSHRDLGGYEIEIAELLASELNAVLSYDWYPQGPDMINLRLRQGHCDMVLGVLDSTESMLTTMAYLRTSYVFVYKEGAPFNITSLDDVVLKSLRIGTEATGIPPQVGLMNRGELVHPIIDYGRALFSPGPYPYDVFLEAVATGEIDVALAWGPLAGYYATRQEAPLVVTPVLPEVEPPLLSQVADLSIGVRLGDQALADRLTVALASRWTEVQAILDRYSIPRLPLPQPQAEPSGSR